MHFRSLLCTAILIFSLSTSLKAESLQVVVSVRPITLLVQELTQSLPVKIQTLLPRGATPHDYALKLSDIREIQQADLVVWLGPGSEAYLSKAMTHADHQVIWEALPGLNLLPLRGALHGGNSHGHEHHHSHDSHLSQLDPHFWLSVPNSLLLLDQILNILVQLYPDGEAQLNKNKNRMQKQLQGHLKKSKEMLAVQTSPFILAHDAYQYIEKDLSIRSLATVVLDPEVNPGIKHIFTLKKWVRSKNVACVVTDPTVSSDLVKKIDPHGHLKRIAIDPLGWDFTDNQYSEWINRTYQKLEACLATTNLNS